MYYLEIITRRSRSQTNSPRRQSHFAGEFARAPTDIGTVLTSQFAQFSLVDVRVVLRRERASLQVPFQTYRSQTFTLWKQINNYIENMWLAFIRMNIWFTLMHNCVPLLHLVLSGRGLGDGHSALLPLQCDDIEQSDSVLHNSCS